MLLKLGRPRLRADCGGATVTNRQSARRARTSWRLLEKCYVEISVGSEFQDGRSKEVLSSRTLDGARGTAPVFQLSISRRACGSFGSFLLSAPYVPTSKTKQDKAGKLLQAKQLRTSKRHSVSEDPKEADQQANQETNLCGSDDVAWRALFVYLQGLMRQVIPGTADPQSLRPMNPGPVDE